MAKKAIIKGKIYKETGTSKVRLHGGIHRQTSAPPASAPALLILAIPA